VIKMEIPEFKFILNEISKLKSILTENINSTEWQAEWYNDEACWQKKGGCSLSTYRSNRFFQCKGGIPDAYVGGRKVWSRASVQEWAKLTDDKLEEYHKKYATGAKRR